MNAGPYTDNDAQEYRDGPVTRGDCTLCGYPVPLCACPPVPRSERCYTCHEPEWLCECEWLAAFHSEPADTSALIGWWPTALFAVAALVVAAIVVRWPL